MIVVHVSTDKNYSDWGKRDERFLSIHDAYLKNVLKKAYGLLCRWNELKQNHKKLPATK